MRKNIVHRALFHQMKTIAGSERATLSIQLEQTHCLTYRLRKFIVSVGFVLGFGLLSQPQTAQAQAFPCPNGPGPGEVQVGVTGGSHGVAAIALCATVSNPDSSDSSRTSHSQPSRLPEFKESYMVVAWHKDSSAVWATAGHSQSNDAKKASLDVCNQAMGDKNCYYEVWINQSYIAVTHDEFGIPWVRGAANQSQNAKDKAMAECETHSFGCKFTKTFSYIMVPYAAPFGKDYAEKDIPQIPITRHHFGLTAWPAQEPHAKWRGHTWLTTGQQNSKLAENKLLQQCQTQALVPCKLGYQIPNGVLVRYVDDKGLNVWIGVAKEQDAEARVKKKCPKDAQCRIVEMFDTQTARDLVINELKSTAPLRGFLGTAWPSVYVPHWKKVAIVTGRASSADAKAAAISLCESQSKVRCESFLDEDDYGTAQFFGLFQDSDESTRGYFGFSPTEVEQRAQTSCARAKVTCTKRVIIDLAVRTDTAY